MFLRLTIRALSLRRFLFTLNQVDLVHYLYMIHIVKFGNRDIIILIISFRIMAEISTLQTVASEHSRMLHALHVNGKPLPGLLSDEIWAADMTHQVNLYPFVPCQFYRL